jgi:hypothetical protein
MDRKIVIILKAPMDNDMFFNNHSLVIHGRIPGDNEVLWYKQDIDHMPSSVVINVPGDVQGDFYLKFTVEDKSVGIVLYQSGAPLYLTMQTMKNRYKCVVLERK